MGEPGGNGAAVRAGRRDGGGRAARRRLLHGVELNRERDGRDLAADLY